MDSVEDIFDYEDTLGERPECNTGQYVLGTVLRPMEETDWILDWRIDLRIFYNFTYPLVIEYAFTGEPDTYFSEELEIVQIVVKDDVYTVVIKTYWLRVFQRRWRRIYKARQQWLQSVKKNIVSVVMQRSLGRRMVFPRTL